VLRPKNEDDTNAQADGRKCARLGESVGVSLVSRVAGESIGVAGNVLIEDVGVL
jgi:hypothetical protein